MQQKIINIYQIIYEFMNTNILIRLILGVITFLYAFNIIGISSLIEKRKNYFKIISILLIGSAIISIASLDFNNKDWTDKDKQLWKQACVNTKDSLNQKYPKYYEEYCDCAIEKIMQNMNRKEVYESKVQKLDLEVKYAKNCLIELHQKVTNISK